MNCPEFRIPEDKAQDVFTLAAQLYAQHNQSYSVQELMEAGTEAKIPPEFIQQAINEIQLQESLTPSSMNQTKRSTPLLIGLAVGLPTLIALGVAGWLLPKTAATNAAINEPVEHLTQVSDISMAVSHFNCAGLDLKGADLSNENLKGADCTRAELVNANLSNTNLEGANLSHADLENANLNGANLRGADLANANLARANLTGANLEGANLSNSTLKDADLRNAHIRNTDLAGANLKDAKK